MLDSNASLTARGMGNWEFCNKATCTNDHTSQQLVKMSLFFCFLKGMWPPVIINGVLFKSGIAHLKRFDKFF